MIRHVRIVRNAFHDMLALRTLESVLVQLNWRAWDFRIGAIIPARSGVCRCCSGVDALDTSRSGSILPRRCFVAGADRCAVATSCQLSSFFPFLSQLSSRHRSFEVLFLSIACDIRSSIQSTPRTELCAFFAPGRLSAYSQIDYRIWHPILAFKTVSNRLLDNCAIGPGTFGVAALTDFWTLWLIAVPSGQQCSRIELT